MIGARVRQARLAAGLSLDQLASKLTRPLTKQALSKYETNKSEPSASTLVDIARALAVKPSYLLSEPEVSVTWAAYRKRSSLSTRNQETITAIATRRLESELQLRNLFGVGLKDTLPREIPVYDAQTAEQAAELVRTGWDLGLFPINGLIETVEDHGGIVLSWAEDRAFDGLSGWTGDECPVIVINSATTADRRRFDVAHELGHLVMALREDTADYESLAHRFAAALLVPRDAALRELGNKRRNLSIPELGLLKERWGLSMQGWIRRAYDLEVIDYRQYRALNILFRQHAWHRLEPYQYEGTEEPLLLRRLVWRALTEGIISAREAKEIYPAYESEKGTLDALEPSLRQIAQLPRDERHRLIAAAHLEVDEAEVELWDAASCDALNGEAK